MERYALTGTPGTGKTTISGLLNNKIISLSDYYEKFSDGKGDDGEWIVNVNDLNSSIRDLEWEIAEGNFSHRLNVIDKAIVLRCDPVVLAKRLKEGVPTDASVDAILDAINPLLPTPHKIIFDWQFTIALTALSKFLFKDFFNNFNASISKLITWWAINLEFFFLINETIYRL